MIYTLAFCDDSNLENKTYKIDDVEVTEFSTKNPLTQYELRMFTRVYATKNANNQLPALFFSLVNFNLLDKRNDFDDILDKKLYRFEPISQDERAIPLILHQMWLSPNNADPPKKYEKAQSTWVNYHPNWEIKIWNSEKIDVFVLQYFPQYYEQFTNLPKIILKCDIARMMVLFIEGGLYADLDFYCLKPFDNFLCDKEIAVFQEIQEHQIQGKKLFNGILASKPNHYFIGNYIDQMFINVNKNIKNIDVMYTTGPNAFHIYAQKYPEIVPLKGTIVMPYTNKKVISKEYKNEDSHAYTLWDEGTNWGYSDVSSNIFQILMLLAIILIIFLVLYLISLSVSKRRRELQQSQLRI
jgi:mannosyltransferase OCH1-like enzyme